MCNDTTVKIEPFALTYELLVVGLHGTLKTLALLLTILADVFGRSPQVSSVTEASEISDLVDFL